MTNLPAKQESRGEDLPVVRTGRIIGGWTFMAAVVTAAAFYFEAIPILFAGSLWIAVAGLAGLHLANRRHELTVAQAQLHHQAALDAHDRAREVEALSREQAQLARCVLRLNTYAAHVGMYTRQDSDPVLRARNDLRQALDTYLDVATALPIEAARVRAWRNWRVLLAASEPGRQVDYDALRGWLEEKNPHLASQFALAAAEVGALEREGRVFSAPAGGETPTSPSPESQALPR